MKYLLKYWFFLQNSFRFVLSIKNWPLRIGTPYQRCANLRARFILTHLKSFFFFNAQFYSLCRKFNLHSSFASTFTDLTVSWKRQYSPKQSPEKNEATVVLKMKDLRLRERTENVEWGGWHIAGTEYQS